MRTPLQIQERRIDPDCLVVNLEPTAAFFVTCVAVNIIVEHKLYKGECSSLETYVNRKWKSVSICTFYNISYTGKVIQKLRDASFSEDELPSNPTLCLNLLKLEKKLNESIAKIWNANLEHYGGRKNVIACSMEEAVEVEVEPILPVSLASGSPASAAIPEIESDDDSMDMDEEKVSEEEEDADNRGGLSKWRFFSSQSVTFGENEFNCPISLCHDIDIFAKTFHDTIDLDVCLNPDSGIICKHYYGIQPDKSFVNAFQLENWCIPANSDEELLHPKEWTGRPKVIICNPPARPLNTDQVVGNSDYLTPSFINRLLEMLENNLCDHVLLLIPWDLRRKWAPGLMDRFHQAVIF
ncbi:hypothetical protein PhCBS80983_g06328 [Powellomyces hirtus]|uniref:Uncharacterized protein n=1 Tax=Powellomyces hirtus TaxID=109895 RepID=A0A507DNG1_9FUNG|nr:hypothetical protein PhCBS80983_g06328 [Powellomyces hirtus]